MSLLVSVLEEGIVIIVVMLIGVVSTMAKVADVKITNHLNKFLFGAPASILMFVFMGKTDFSVVNWEFLLLFFLCILVPSIVVILSTIFVQQGGLVGLLENLSGGTMTNGVVFGIPFVRGIFGPQYIPYVMIGGVVEIGLQFTGLLVLLAACKAEERKNSIQRDSLAMNIVHPEPGTVDVDVENQDQPIPPPLKFALGKMIKLSLVQLLKTPPLWGFAAGLVWGAAGAPFPSLLDRILTPVANASIPILLIVVGMFVVQSVQELRERWNDARGVWSAIVNWKKLAGLLVFKLFGLVLLALPVCFAFTDAIAIRITLLILACPTALTSYLLCAQLEDKRSAQLEVVVIVLSSFLSVLCIFGLFAILDAASLWIVQ